jgi:hypothetical protein
VSTSISSKRSIEDISIVISSEQTDSGATDTALLSILPKLHFTLIFQSFPVWLLSLDPSFVDTIRFPSFISTEHLCSSLESRNLDANIVLRCLHRFGSHKLLFGIHERGDIILVSGSLSFLLVYLQDTSVPYLSVLDHHYSARLRNQRPSGIGVQGMGHVSCHRVRHVAVGGCTLYIVLVGQSGCSIDPSTTQLQRTLRHYIDYSVRSPFLWSVSVTSSLTPDDLLRPGSLDSPVKYRTPFSHDGLGVRHLTSNELGTIFGIHSRLRMGGIPMRTFDTLLSVGLLDSILRPVILSVQRSPPMSADHPQPRHFAINDPPSRTWLSSL